MLPTRETIPQIKILLFEYNLMVDHKITNIWKSHRVLHHLPTSVVNNLIYNRWKILVEVVQKRLSLSEFVTERVRMTLKLLHLILLQVHNSPCPRFFWAGWVFYGVGFLFGVFFFSLCFQAFGFFSFFPPEASVSHFWLLNHPWSHKTLSGILNQPTIK